jgi:large subunit ribosomal protein L28e
MVAVPDQLVWELTKNNSSFIRKRNGHTKRSGTISFSVEKGNLKSLNLFKYSGLANSKTIDVVCTDENRAQLIKKTASKAGTKPAKAVAVTNINKDFRRSEKVLLSQTADVYYRRDLKAAALGKYTKVYQANRRAKGITKPVPVKKGRGTLGGGEAGED